MTEEEIVNRNEEEVSDTLFKAVVSVSVKTAFYLILFISVFASYLCLRLPYQSMKLYQDLGMDKNALAMAESIVRQDKGDKQYTEALLTGIELADKLLTKDAKKEDRYAKKLISLTQKYALAPNFYAQNALLDGFYLTEIKLAPKNLLYSYLTFYSYKDYVYTLNFKARAILNKTDKILMGDVLADTLQITSQDLAGLSLNNLAVFYNQISAYLSVKGTGSLLFSDNLLYSSIINTADSFINISLNSEGISIENRLYLIKAAYKLSESLCDFCQNNGHNDKIPEINSAFKISESQSLWQYLETQINDYK